MTAARVPWLPFVGWAAFKRVLFRTLRRLPGQLAMACALTAGHVMNRTQATALALRQGGVRG